MYTYIYMCVYLCFCLYTYMLHIYIYIHLYIYIYTYVCIQGPAVEQGKPHNYIRGPKYPKSGQFAWYVSLNNY